MDSDFETPFDTASVKLLEGCLTLDKQTSKGKSVQVGGLTWRIEDERRNTFAAFFLSVSPLSACTLVEDWRCIVTVPEIRCGTVRRVMRETLCFHKDAMKCLLYIASEDEVGYGYGDCFGESKSEHKDIKGVAFACKIVVRPRGVFLRCDGLESEERPEKDYFTDPNKAVEMLSDCRLVLDDYSLIHVNKSHLAIYSNFFRTLFYGDFAEKDKSDIPLREVSKEELLQFLRCLYQPHDPIDAHNVENVLKLADRFECNFLIADCVQFLLKRSLGTLEDVKKYIEIADRCNLPQVLHSALNRAEFRVLPELLEPQWLHSLNIDTMDRILEKARECFRR